MTTLALASRDVLTAIERAAIADSTKEKYRRAVAEYLDAGGDLFDAAQLADYAAGLSQSGKSFLRAVVKLVTDDLALRVKAMATPANVDAVRANLLRIEALQSAIQVKAAAGRKAHIWLSQAEVKALLATCDDSLRGRRDRLALGLLVAAGLRRQEAADHAFDEVLLQPVAGKLRTVLAVKGKGAKHRTVPISDALANAIDDWGRAAGLGGGAILRSFDRRGELRGGISAVAIFHVVRAHGARIGKPTLAPHDLRRTYAQIGLDAGVPVTQISKLLGHASLATTQKYLDLEVDLESTVSDFVPFA